MFERIGATMIAAECVRGKAERTPGGPRTRLADGHVGGSTDLGGSHRPNEIPELSPESVARERTQVAEARERDGGVEWTSPGTG